MSGGEFSEQGKQCSDGCMMAVQNGRLCETNVSFPKSGGGGGRAVQTGHRQAERQSFKRMVRGAGSRVSSLGFGVWGFGFGV